MFNTCWFPDDNLSKNKDGIFILSKLLHLLRVEGSTALQMVDLDLPFMVSVNLFVLLFYVNLLA